jgi:uncharacterized protein with ATP-grasp and redox domains
MPIFSLLADPDRYDPCSNGDMLIDHAYREHWAAHFERHFETVLKLALEVYGPSASERIDACRNDFVAFVRKARYEPQSFPLLDLLVFDVVRQEKLIAHGLPDPFEKAKARENEASLPLYPKVVSELDSHDDPREALLLATEGIFAGNIFDLGAGPTTKMFAENSPDFFAVRDGLDGKRPWLVDHFDAMAERLLAVPKRYHQAMFFCDNAGSDLILGVMPFCRLLAKSGVRVLIAANHLPALNDTTAKELAALLPRLEAIDPILHTLVRDERIRVIDSGGIAPLIDLRDVSAEVNHHAAETDLVILEGMGRALESNFDARFKVDAIKLAMIKDEAVAERHGGKNFDTVCRFDPA